MAKQKAKILVIDFRPNDITGAITKLQSLNDSGEIAGLLFVAKIKGKKKPVMGAAGCCVTDPMSAMGAAASLLRAVTDLSLHD